MTAAYDDTLKRLSRERHSWLVTGVAGFIGSNLLEALLRLDQRVVGIDNLATGHRRNLAEVQGLVGSERWSRFRFLEGDIRKMDDCRAACENVDFVLHQAALGSVPRSVADPLTTNATNVSGFLNMLVAARDVKVRRFVYAASSSTYGDLAELPKVEERIGRPLSPYAVTKYVNELYAEVFARTYGTQTVGLRYFNVFGRRQDPEGAYAAVIPKWVASMIDGIPVVINGDGETSRDFCFVDNAVQANLLAATTQNPVAVNEVYNVAVGERTTLNQLYAELRDALAVHCSHVTGARPVHGELRKGDIRHSLADVGKAGTRLGYQPTHTLKQGIAVVVPWYVQQSRQREQR